MRLINIWICVVVMLVIAAALIVALNQAIANLSSMPTATRFEQIDGQPVPIWNTNHRGESVRIYICPGQAPELAIAHEQIDCGDPTP